MHVGHARGSTPLAEPPPPPPLGIRLGGVGVFAGELRQMLEAGVLLTLGVVVMRDDGWWRAAGVGEIGVCSQNEKPTNRSQLQQLTTSNRRSCLLW